MIKNRRHYEHALYRTGMALAGLAVAALLAGCASAPGVAPKPTGWTKDEMSDSYVFGYPLVLMDLARESATGIGPGQAPIDTLRHADTPPPVGVASPKFPDLDTLESQGWLDVANGPVLVSLPDTHGRYVDARALDMWTNVVWSSGAQITARSHGLKAQTIAFVHTGWTGELPPHTTRVDVPTRYVRLFVNIQVHDERDLAAVRRLQHAIRVAPLAAAQDNADTKAEAVANRMPHVSGSADDQVAALDAYGFLDRLARALEDNPPVPDDPHALKELADLGVHPGEAVELPSGGSDVLAAGLADGRSRVSTPPSNLFAGNGWTWIGEGAGNYGTDYVLRAYAAWSRPGLGTREDTVLARTSLDSDGRPLNGANRYRIHFPPGQLPPVRAFWSITAYTASGALDAAAPVHALLGEQTTRRNRDGSLDVYVSAQRHRGNWVPAPSGDFQLVLRLHAPTPKIADGSWQPPAVERE